MSDMSDPSNSSAGPIRVVVLRGITVDISPAGGLIVSIVSVVLTSVVKEETSRPS